MTHFGLDMYCLSKKQLPIFIVKYYIKYVITSWTDSTYKYKNKMSTGGRNCQIRKQRDRPTNRKTNGQMDRKVGSL